MGLGRLRPAGLRRRVTVFPVTSAESADIGCDLCNSVCAETWCRNRSARVHPTTIDRLGIRYDPERRWTEPPFCGTADKELEDKGQQRYRYAIARSERSFCSDLTLRGFIEERMYSGRAAWYDLARNDRSSSVFGCCVMFKNLSRSLRSCER